MLAVLALLLLIPPINITATPDAPWEQPYTLTVGPGNQVCRAGFIGVQNGSGIEPRAITVCDCQAGLDADEADPIAAAWIAANDPEPQAAHTEP